MSVADLKASGVVSAAKGSLWLNSGIATIAAAATNASVVDTSITASSVVLVQYLGAALDATCTSIVRVSLVAGVGFTIVGNAAATAPVSVAYMVAKY